MTTTYLLTALRIMMVLLWMPALAFAGTVTIQATLDGVTASAFAIVALLSSLSGATALVWRIDKLLREAPGATLPRPGLFAIAHMLGSWLAGVLAVITAEGQDMNDWMELGFIVIASFMGAKFVEYIAEKTIAARVGLPKEPTV